MSGQKMEDATEIYNHVHKQAVSLLDQMSLAEKVRILSGRDLFCTSGCSRLGLPYLKTSDGPNGVRGTTTGMEFICGFPFHVTGRPAPGSALFPCATSLASTWSRSAARRTGAGIAIDGLSKGVHVVLAPTINIIRDPRNGRTFENLSEDPLLTGHLASQWTCGAQEDAGMLVTLKHFVCNECETDRHTSDVLLDDAVLRELYLKPFQIVLEELDQLRKLQPAAIMTSYNYLRGVACSADGSLMEDILRGEWNFKGLTMSDWFGTYARPDVTLNAGLDLEMPGPPRSRQLPAIQAALDKGILSQAVLNQRVLKVVEMIILSQTLAKNTPFHLESEDNADTESGSYPTREEIELHRGLGAEGCVLLKNESATLPLNLSKLRKVVVIGEPALKGFASGGGSAGMPPCYVTSPIESLKAKLPSTVSVEWYRGRHLTSSIPPPTPTQLDNTPVTLEWFEVDPSTEESKGLPFHIEQCPTSELRNFGGGGYVSPTDDVIIRSSFDFIPSMTGDTLISLQCLGKMKLSATSSVSHTELISSWHYAGETEVPVFMFSPNRLREVRTIPARVGERVHISFEYKPPKVFDEHLPDCKAAFRIGIQEFVDEAAVQAEAVTACVDADVAIVFTGTGPEYESEGSDRQAIALPRDQDGLVAAIAESAAGRTVVVNSTGSAIAMPWAEDDRVPSILQVWFSGMERGNVISDVLLGTREPGGRLPATWPRQLEDHPSYGNFPITKGIHSSDGLKPVEYKEGLLYGHRWYEEKGIQPLWWFGHGLSYSSFDVRINARGDLTMPSGMDSSIDLAISVTNTGARIGKHVIQVYETSATGPRRLVAFCDVQNVEPGKTQEVAVSLTARSLSRWDTQSKSWNVRPGKREFVLAKSSDPRSVTSSFAVEIQV